MLTQPRKSAEKYEDLREKKRKLLHRNVKLRGVHYRKDIRIVSNTDIIMPSPLHDTKYAIVVAECHFNSLLQRYDEQKETALLHRVMQ